MTQATDASLIERSLRGERPAFETLLYRYQDRVYSLCLRMAGRPEEAEDLAQESLLRLYRGLSTIDPDRPLWPWLRRLTMNTCLNELRRRQPDTFTDVWLEDTSVARQHRGRDRETNRVERMDLAVALAHLKPDHRAVLVLRYLEGLTSREIAASLNTSVVAVEARAHRARKALKHRLRSLDSNPTLNTFSSKSGRKTTQ